MMENQGMHGPWGDLKTIQEKDYLKNICGDVLSEN